MNAPLPSPILDTHQHLWDLSRLRPPWISGDLATNHTQAEYAHAAAGLNVAGTIYMEVAVADDDLVTEAKFVLERSRSGDDTPPMRGAVIGGRPDDPGFAAYLDRFGDDPHLKGVRQTLHGGTPKGTCLSDEYVRGVRLLGERGLRFDLCLRPGDLLDGAALAERCPDTRFVLDHCGNPNVQWTDFSAWKRDLAAVAARPNVIGKVSGLVNTVQPNAWSADDLAPIVDHVLDSFGPNRVVFGSDWPVCTVAGATYRQWVDALRQIVSTRPEHEQRCLFHDNAIRFYEIA